MSSREERHQRRAAEAGRQLPDQSVPAAPASAAPVAPSSVGLGSASREERRKPRRAAAPAGRQLPDRAGAPAAPASAAPPASVGLGSAFALFQSEIPASTSRLALQSCLPKLPNVGAAIRKRMAELGTTMKAHIFITDCSGDNEFDGDDDGVATLGGTCVVGPKSAKVSVAAEESDYGESASLEIVDVKSGRCLFSLTVEGGRLSFDTASQEDLRDFFDKTTGILGPGRDYRTPDEREYHSFAGKAADKDPTLMIGDLVAIVWPQMLARADKDAMFRNDFVDLARMYAELEKKTNEQKTKRRKVDA